VLAIDPGGSVRRVPGGVAGWLAERSTGSAPKPAAPRSSAPKVAPAAKPKGAPSQYTVGRQLRETEQAMVKAQKRVDQLTERLAGLTDHAELHSLGSDLAAAQAELDELESRWLELAELQMN
jgi:ATP-binding cassette subfamily F protein uup